MKKQYYLLLIGCLCYVQGISQVKYFTIPDKFLQFSEYHSIVDDKLRSRLKALESYTDDDSSVIFSNYLLTLQTNFYTVYNAGKLDKALIALDKMRDFHIYATQTRVYDNDSAIIPPITGRNIITKYLISNFANTANVIMRTGDYASAIRYATFAKELSDRYFLFVDEQQQQHISQQDLDLAHFFKEEFPKQERDSLISIYFPRLSSIPNMRYAQLTNGLMNLAMDKESNGEFKESLLLHRLLKDTWIEVDRSQSVKKIFRLMARIQSNQDAMTDPALMNTESNIAWYLYYRKIITTFYIIKTRLYKKQGIHQDIYESEQLFLVNELIDILRYQISTHHSLGMLNSVIGNYEYALDNFLIGKNLIEAVWKKHGNQQDFSNIPALQDFYYLDLLKENSCDIAELYIVKNDLEKARLILETTEQVLVSYKVKKIDHLRLWKLMSYIHRRQLKKEKSLDYLKKTNKIVGKKNSVFACDNFKGLGDHYLQFNQADSAKYFYQKCISLALKINYQSILPDCYGAIGTIYRDRQDYAKAQSYYEKSLAIAKEVDTELFSVYPHLNLGQNYLEQEKHDTALVYFKEAIRLIEQDVPLSQNGKESKNLIKAKLLSAYEGAINCLYQLGQYEAVFTYMEKAKARTFAELLTEQVITVKNIPPPLLEEEVNLYAQLNNNNRLIYETTSTKKQQKLYEEQKLLIEKLRILKTKIRNEVPEYAQIKYPEVITLKQVQQNLKKDEVMLRYFIGEHSAHLMIFDNDDYQHIPLSHPKKIKHLTTTLRNALQKNKFESSQDLFFNTSAQLYQHLITPAEQTNLLTNKKLLIVTTGILQQLPFELLIADTIQKGDYAAYKYLVKKYPIIYHPSATTMYFEKHPQKRNISPTKDILLFGNPIMSRTATKDIQDKDTSSASERSSTPINVKNLNPLRYAKRELENIRQLFPNSKMLSGRDATETNLKKENLADYRYLHFATHSVLDDEYPELSSIVMTQEESKLQDGLLNLYEISDLDINPELVILSACETGLGKIVKGEGILGFTRSWLYAGTPSLIVSLWQVDDKSTALFFSSYYKHLKASNGTDKYGALRAAQLEMMNSFYSEPYYWAPFIYIGKTD